MWANTMQCNTNMTQYKGQHYNNNNDDKPDMIHTI